MAKRPTTRVSPGSISIGAMGGLVKLNPNETAFQSQIIPDATPKNSGVMTAAQAAKLAGLTPGGGGFTVVSASAPTIAGLGQLINGDSSGGAFSVTLPAAVTGTPNNNVVVIKNEAPSGNGITILPNGGDTIDDSSSTPILPPQGFLYLVSDGVSNWITISNNQLPFLDVSLFPGADLGAKIQSADAFLGNTPGTLYVPDGNYTWSTHTSLLHQNRTLLFGAGVITCIGQNPFFFPYPGPMAILNDNTIVRGQGAATIFDEPDSGVLFAPNTSAGFTNVHISDFTVQNIANTDPLQLGSSLPNIGFDNSKDSSCRDINFINTRSLGFSCGGTSAGGDHANGITLTNCLFDGVKCITVACVNGRNFNYNHLTFKNVGTTGPNAPYAAIVCIDLEPNTNTDFIENFAVSDCIFDMRNNLGGACILVQGAGVGRNGVVSNNVIEAGSDASTGTTTGITVTGQTDVLVTGNVITGQFSQISVDIDGCIRTVVSGNTIRSSGGPLSGNRTILIRQSSVDCKIFGNLIAVDALDAGWASIADDNTCTNTQVFGNSLTGLGTPSNPYPTIELSGTGDGQWSNIINGVMQPGNTLIFLSDNQDATGAGTVTQGSNVFADIAPYPTFTVAVPADGIYEVFAMLEGIYSTGAVGEFQIMVDGVVVPGTLQRAPLDVNAYHPIVLRGSILLARGNRVIKTQWRNVSGAGVNMDTTIAGATYGSRTYGIRS